MALSFARPKKSDKDIIKKSKTTKTRTTVKGGGNIAAQIQSIITLAETKLAHHKDDYIVIRDMETLNEYIDVANNNGEMALDTETTGLNPLLLDIVGVCLYTPSKKACYIPINHKSYITGVRTSNQLNEKQVREALLRFNGKYIMHNASFDVRVCRHTLKLDLECWWDTQIAGCCIDEIESHKLKDLHLKYCDSKDEESLTFEKLFGGITFDLVPINTAQLYAAGDAVKTFEVYKYQQTLLNRRVLSGPYNVFRNIEMPLVNVVCDMEDRGVALDYEVLDYLHNKYHGLMNEAQAQADKSLAMYEDDIINYKMQHPDHKLSEPINISSPTQLAVLFYDILKLKSPDKKKPRGTGEEILLEFAKGKHKNLCNAILEVRSLDKLIGTYIDKMPQVAIDGRVHTEYKQYGAKTGRFSSKNPNLQNIPSHNKEIRKMFKATDGYVLIGADYSQQEPMVTAHLSQDKKMIKAFTDGKDIYSTIAALAFHKTYEDCLEFMTKSNGDYVLDEHGERITYDAGKERRGRAKGIVLGILYGRQIPSIADELGVTTKEAQNIYDSVLKAFPQLASFIDESQGMAKDIGYVDTAWGRRRHLPDMQLEPYVYSYDGKQVNFDPLAFNEEADGEVPVSIKNEYNKKFARCKKWKDREKVKQELAYKGIKVHDNGGFIAQAERQCVNSRVQGSAADMVKLSMIAINNDPIMKELDFHLLIQVHDEVIGECPEENMKEAAERLSYLMRTVPKDTIDLPFKCDVEITRNWYGEKIS